MLVRKSKISQLIKKERRKERHICQRESFMRLQETKQRLSEEHAAEMKQARQEFKKQLKLMEKENSRLRREIDRHYATFQSVRKREAQLDELSHEIEGVIETMNIRVQESLQPFYRTRNKIESTKRKADRGNEKVESIFRAIK